MAADHNSFANLIWQIADLLRGPYRPPQYERVMLPMTVLRRFDCVLAPTKSKVVAEYERSKGGKLAGDALDTKLNKVAGQRFHNHSPLDFEKLKGDPDNVNKHLVSYIKGFSANVQRIFEYFELETEIEKMHEANILYLVVSKFADVDLHPSNVPNEQMGLIFENLIRRFNELANETAGDHFTPREVIRLMVNLLFIHDDKLLATAGTVRKLLDPACGTGGMLAEAQRYLREHNTEAKLYAYGQDYNKRAFATAASDMLMKEVSHNGGGDNVRFGDIFTEDQFPSETFDYFLSNPPFGVDWKKQQKEIRKEHEKRGFDGRFGAGLPRVNDGALLFLQHMWSKREDVKPKEHKEGSRLAIVFSGSPMFTGGAGSGESEIRKWLLENDWLEAIITKDSESWDDIGVPALVVETADDLVCGYHLALLRPHASSLSGPFLLRCLQAKVLRLQLELAANGVTRFGLPKSEIGSMRLPVSPIDTQVAIAEFLDRETARLDALVIAKQRLLDLLAEKRKAIIATAVTRGLDPKVKLRDSGVPWLGEIPAHWNASRLKFVATVQTGIALGKDFGGHALLEYPYLRVANVQDGFIDISDVKTILVPEREAAGAMLRRGDVLMNEGGDADKLGRGAVWDGAIDPCLHQNHVFALRPTGVSSAWLSAWTGSDYAKAYFETRAKQSTNLASISSTNLLELPIAVPPADEQQAIVEHIARETAKLDAVRAATERTIALLKERRAALIAAAVTGQLDVGAAA